MSLKLNLPFDAVTGDLLETARSPRMVASNPVTAKIQPNLPVRVQLVDGDTGALVAAVGGIKIGFKPVGHYSDLVFDLYADNFLPVGDTGDDLLTYETRMIANGPDLTALFAPNSLGVSPDTVELIGEVKIGDVPTATFRMLATNNIIKDIESAAIAPGDVRGFASVRLQQVDAPTLTVTAQGATGAYTWSYAVEAVLADGTTTGYGSTATVVNGVGALTSTHCNKLT